MSKKERPLSPHLMIYKPQITSMTSITHRATGVALSLGTLLIVWWLGALGAGAESYETVQACLQSWFGKLVLVGFTWALFYHLSNGIRHLLWDAGYGFEITTARKTGWLVLAVSVALTAVTWLFLMMGV